MSTLAVALQAPPGALSRRVSDAGKSRFASPIRCAADPDDVEWPRRPPSTTVWAMSGASPRTSIPTARPRLSSRTRHLREASLLRSLTQRVAAFPDGINLGQGVCDLEMPDVLRAAAVRSLREDRATYTPFGGLE